MRSISRARSAKPSATRATVTTGLAALVLPLCLASPAFAEPAAPGAAEAAAPGAAEAAVAAPAPVRKAGALMRISGPRSAVAPGPQRIGVRLLADAVRPVAGSQVVVQRSNGTGWTEIGRITTDGQGLAVGNFDFRTSTRVRAISAGSATLSPGVTSAIPVAVNAHLRKAAPAAKPAAPAPAPAAAGFAARAVQIAASQAGKPYRYGSAGPHSFDCSGLINFAFAKAGKRLPRTSAALAATTKPVSKAAARPGDLIFMRSGGRVSHAGIYAGNGRIVDAPSAGGRVSTRPLWTSNYTVGRVV